MEWVLVIRLGMTFMGFYTTADNIEFETKHDRHEARDFEINRARESGWGRNLIICKPNKF